MSCVPERQALLCLLPSADALHEAGLLSQGILTRDGRSGRTRDLGRRPLARRGQEASDAERHRARVRSASVIDQQARRPRAFTDGVEATSPIRFS